MDIKDYSEKYSDHYSGDFKFEPVLVKARRKKILESVSKHNHKNMLEIGCGMEPFFSFIDDYEKFIIVEPSGDFCRNAEKLAEGNTRVSVIQGFFEEREPELKSMMPYDFIIFSSLIHEVPDPQGFLKKLHSLCGKNTVVHINVPNMYSFHRLLAVEAGIIKDIHSKSELDNKFQRTGNFDMEMLINEAEDAGFRIIDNGTYFIKTLTNSQYEKAIAQKIFDERIFDGLERMIKYMPELGAEMFIDVKIK